MDPKSRNISKFSFWEMIVFLSRYRWMAIGSMFFGLLLSAFVYYEGSKKPSKTDWEWIVRSEVSNRRSITASIFSEFFTYESFVRAFYLEVIRLKQIDLAEKDIKRLIASDFAGEIGVLSADSHIDGSFRVLFRWPHELGSPEGDLIPKAFNHALIIVSNESSKIFQDYSASLVEVEKSQGRLIAYLLKKSAKPTSEVLQLLDSKLVTAAGRRPSSGFMILLESVTENEAEKSDLIKTYAEIAAKEDALDRARDRYVAKFGIFSILEFQPLEARSVPRLLGVVSGGVIGIPAILFFLGGLFGLCLGVMIVLIYRFVQTNRPRFSETSREVT